MTFTDLLEQLDTNGKDAKLNIKKVILTDENTLLDELSTQAIVLAVSLSLQSQPLIDAARTFTKDCHDDIKNAAAICANIMAMNNVYYRATHLIESSNLTKQPAGLRMQGLVQHNINKGLFELMSLAVSTINGCGLCLQSHYQQLQAHYRDEQIAQALRISASLAALNQSLYSSGFEIESSYTI